MSDFKLDGLFKPEHITDITAGAVIIIIGWLIARLISGTFVRTMQHRATAHQLLLGRRTIFYVLLILFTLSGLREMGFKLSVLLGAAGVLSVAIGFASQTSASNLISGLFLIGEGPFSIGDFIRVGQTEGEVLSIDLLSVKLRTADNLFVRIPNEQLIKTEVINMTRFPIRRLNLPIGIAYKEDIGKVREVLLEVAKRSPLCLNEPAPYIIVQGFGASSVDLMFYIWTRRENFLMMRDLMQESIKRAFDDAGIEIPFPQVSVHAGAGSSPLPLQIIGSGLTDSTPNNK
ncbi:MAG: mechanosensitive ion channel family protein [Moraxellaceae bacterium]|jgi:small-conductance mechanosensitive channel|nr:mechanosensitive ion channel family protein [Moraxellaceae bacterium]MBP7228819.1 mechanosensitive ion channel family protein [Moraxellaceae bacterium]MBP8852536.1 mechanosensitive ion channel family protein [Moraxellaceae bacterium]MBP9045170.1 mechanosensitive ion channel family protein [Moraxellaceae bacterium]MBP9730227.1 mechanosensitive ion channel family protein [Moraxellaceae bacterium]